MKTLNKSTFLAVLITATALTFSACSSVNNEVEELSEEDITMAAQIVGSSLADNESGVMSSMYDAFSSVTDNSIEYGTAPQFKSVSSSADDHRRRGGRGGERNFTHEYDPTTGTHYLSYDRSFNNGEISNSVSVNQEIIFTGIDGNWLAEPRVDRDSIESINFIGSKTGEHNGIFRSSEFTKIDSMRINGIHATSGTLSLGGTHYGNGQASGITRDSSEVSRAFTVNIEFSNVEIVKDTVLAYGNLENGVSGTLTYSIVMTHTRNGSTREKVVEGTIDLEEDGTALMRFNKLPQVIRFSLVDGSRDDRPGDDGTRD